MQKRKNQEPIRVVIWMWIIDNLSKSRGLVAWESGLKDGD